MHRTDTGNRDRTYASINDGISFFRAALSSGKKKERENITEKTIERVDRCLKVFDLIGLVNWHKTNVRSSNHSHSSLPLPVKTKNMQIFYILQCFVDNDITATITKLLPRDIAGEESLETFSLQTSN